MASWCALSGKKIVLQLFEYDPLSLCDVTWQFKGSHKYISTEAYATSTYSTRPFLT